MGFSFEDVRVRESESGSLSILFLTQFLQQEGHLKSLEWCMLLIAFLNDMIYLTIKLDINILDYLALLT